MNQTVIIVMLMAVMAGPCWSLSVEANISSQEVGVGEALQLMVKVTAQKKVKDLPWPDVKGDLDAFTVTKNTGTSSSTQTTIVNGRISKQINFVTQFTYSLTAKKPGTYTVGPISYKHKTFRKNLGSTKVKVVKTEPGIKLTTSLSKSRVYVGEQVRYNLRIIPKASVQGIQAPDFKKSIGEKFWMKQLDKEIKAKTVTLNEQPTRVFDARFALFPLLAGQTTLSGFPLEYEEVVAQRRRGRSVFDMFNSDFFGGRRVKKQAHTKAVSLHVVPLPKGAPSGFTNAVGQYQIRASVDKGTLPTGDALTLQVEISGNGQPKAITKPVMPDLSNFEVFTPETKASTKVVGGYFQSFKSFKFVLIPARKGEYEIGAVKFHYFNPKTKSFKTAATAPISVTVTKGKEVTSTQQRFMTQRDIEELGSDIRHIKKRVSSALAADRFIYKTIWYWGLFPIPPLIFFLSLFYRNRTRKLGEDFGLRRKVHAKGVARKRLTKARKAQQGSDSKVYYHSLVQAVERFISDKLNIEFRGMTIDAALETMKAKELPEEVQAEYRQLMEKCDFGQFGRAAKDAVEWNKAYEEAEILINKLNKVL